MVEKNEKTLLRKKKIVLIEKRMAEKWKKRLKRKKNGKNKKEWLKKG